jgi:hypothetical protein
VPPSKPFTTQQICRGLCHASNGSRASVHRPSRRVSRQVLSTSSVPTLSRNFLFKAHETRRDAPLNQAWQSTRGIQSNMPAIFHTTTARLICRCKHQFLPKCCSWQGNGVASSLLNFACYIIHLDTKASLLECSVLCQASFNYIFLFTFPFVEYNLSR